MGELAELVTAIDRALESEMSDRPMTDAEMRELFGDSFTEDYQAEAEQRWGDTDAWKQSASRTARFTRKDWEDVKAEQDAVGAAFAAAMDAGLPATSPEAMAAAQSRRTRASSSCCELLLRDAVRLGRDVSRRPTVHGDLRGAAGGHGALRPRCDQGQRGRCRGVALTRLRRAAQRPSWAV